jgi:hypothetical protein
MKVYCGSGCTDTNVLDLGTCWRCVVSFKQFPPNCIAQPLQNLHAEMASNTLTRRYELMVHQTVDVKQFRNFLTAVLPYRLVLATKTFFQKIICIRIDHATPLYSQKLALTSPTSGGRSVGIVRSRTKATELVSYMPVCTYKTRKQTVDVKQFQERFDCPRSADQDFLSENYLHISRHMHISIYKTRKGLLW